VGPGGSHATIQAGVDAAIAAGGVNHVKVAQGSYPERVSIAASDLGRLTVSGGWRSGFGDREDDPAAVTTIDAGRAGTAISVVGVERGELLFDGFTVTGGRNVGGGLCPLGGGLYVEVAGAARLEFVSSVIAANEIATGEGCPAEGGGVGAILRGRAALALRNLRIERNLATSVSNTATGGGLALYAGDEAEFELTGNTIRENEAVTATDQATGGGLFVSTDSVAVRARINDNVVRANRAEVCVGGCVWIGASDRFEVRRNRWLDNLGPASTKQEQLSLIAEGDSRMVWGDDIVAGGAHGAQLVVGGNGIIDATNLTIADNTASGLAGDVAGGASLSVFNTIAFGNGVDLTLPPTALTAHNLVGMDPRFVDRAGRRYLVMPGSPAIDVGDGAPPAGVGPRDVAGLPRVQGPAVDIGAHEATDGTPGSAAQFCRIDRFGPAPPIPASAPVCSCLRDDVSRNLLCGFHFHDYSAFVRVPLPVPPGVEAPAVWTLHRWGPGEVLFDMKAALLVEGKVIPAEGKGTSGKLVEGKDLKAGFRIPAIVESGVLRTQIRHLPPGAKSPFNGVAEVAIEVSEEPK
jgi:hypothetical protein